jgi:hypothetical protein
VAGGIFYGHWIDGEGRDGVQRTLGVAKVVPNGGKTLYSQYLKKKVSAIG